MTGDRLLLAPLYHWAHRQGENFCTEAFASLIRAGIQRHPADVRHILANLFGVVASELDVDAQTQVRTQVIVDSGRRPDLEIEGSSFLFFVEAKAGADEGDQQLEDYARALAKRTGVPHKSLVYLTDPFIRPRILADDLTGSIRFRHLRWRTTAQAFESLAIKDEVFRFLHSEYEGLLREAGLMVEPVSVDLLRGARQVINMRDMIRAALIHCSRMAKCDAASGQEFTGFFASLEGPEKPRLWVGFNFTDPHKLWIQPQGPTAAEMGRRIGGDSQGRVKVTPGPYGPVPCIDLKAAGFFDKDAEEQAKELTAWLQSAIDATLEVKAKQAHGA